MGDKGKISESKDKFTESDGSDLSSGKIVYFAISKSFDGLSELKREQQSQQSRQT